MTDEPDHCCGCDHLKYNPYGGHCYVFKEKVSNTCAQHTKYPRLPHRTARTMLLLECLRIAADGET